MANLAQILRTTRGGIAIKFLVWTLKILMKVGTKIDYIFSTNKALYDFSKIGSNSPRIFVFVHHSKSGLLDEYDLKVLKEAKISGFSTVLVSNGPICEISNADFVVQKNRNGRDFSVLRDAARSMRLNRNKQIEFFYLNNSMVWQDSAILDLIRNFQNSEKNVLIFPTESFNPLYHVQPYFMYVKLDISVIFKFSSSFEWIRNFHFRRSIIYFNEYRMAGKLNSKNWKIRVVAPYWNLLESENKYRQVSNQVILDSNFKFYNPNQHFWKSLSLFQINGVKRSLIYRNPVGIKDAPCNESNALTSMYVPGEL
jgi:hypothetical protein